MYSIYADDICIYNDISPLENVKLISPKLVLEDSSAGSLTMTVPVTNVGYDKITRLVTDIVVYRNGEELWAGRVLTEEEGFYKSRVLYCEGELAFFNDSTQPQAEYHNKTVRGFLETLVNIHNSKVAENRRFTVGVVTVTDPNDSLYRYTNYEKTIECINEKLINRLGGHMRVRKVNGIRYLDYLADCSNTNSQVIEFGKNLMDFTKTWDLTEFATVILPLGNRLEESPIEALDAYLTVESVNDGSIYVKSDTAVNSYGWIEQVVKWDDVSTPSALLSKAKQYLSDIQFDEMSIELKALDLHYLNIDVEAVKLLDKIHVVSKPHGMDRYFPVSKLEIPLDSPDDTLFTLGDKIKPSLTSVNNKTNSQILQSIENLPKKSVILQEAKDNATAIMNLATNGYITITQDKNGSNALYVSDTLNYKEATRYWLLNMNGFGYSGDGGKTFGLAMTMDGAIVADYITAGTLSGERLKGTIIESSNYVAGTAGTQINLKTGAINMKNFSLTSTGILTASGAIINGTITTESGLYKLTLLNGGMRTTYNNQTIGRMGINNLDGYESKKGLVFDLEYSTNSAYMAWAAKTSSGDSGYSIKLLYANQAFSSYKADTLNLQCDMYTNGHLYLTDSNRFYKFTGGGCGYDGEMSWCDSSGKSAVKINGTDKTFSVFNNVSADFYTNIDMHGYSINNQSDVRLKNNIKECKIDALTLINQIELKSFDWIDSGHHEPIGIIAQQLETIAPELVCVGRDGCLSIRTTNFIYYLIKAVQELSKNNHKVSSTKWKDLFKYEDKKAFCKTLCFGKDNNVEEIQKPVKLSAERVSKIL